jgi:hypothetical protein
MAPLPLLCVKGERDVRLVYIYLTSAGSSQRYENDKTFFEVKASTSVQKEDGRVVAPLRRGNTPH